MMMQSFGHYHVLALFAAFGMVSGFYVSVVGFVITSVVVIAVVAAASAVMGSPFTIGSLILFYVMMQVGFFLAVVGRGLGGHVVRLRASRVMGSAKSEFEAKHDRPQ